MSFTKNNGVSIFPLEFLKQCVEKYTKDHGKAPKILVASHDDIIDWKLSCTIQSAAQLNVKIVPGDYLNPGEFDLAMGIEE